MKSTGLLATLMGMASMQAAPSLLRPTPLPKLSRESKRKLNVNSGNKLAKKAAKGTLGLTKS